MKTFHPGGEEIAESINSGVRVLIAGKVLREYPQYTKRVFFEAGNLIYQHVFLTHQSQTHPLCSKTFHDDRC